MSRLPLIHEPHVPEGDLAASLEWSCADWRDAFDLEVFIFCMGTALLVCCVCMRMVRPDGLQVPEGRDSGHGARIGRLHVRFLEHRPHFGVSLTSSHERSGMVLPRFSQHINPSTRKMRLFFIQNRAQNRPSPGLLVSMSITGNPGDLINIRSETNTCCLQSA